MHTIISAAVQPGVRWGAPYGWLGLRVLLVAVEQVNGYPLELHPPSPLLFVQRQVARGELGVGGVGLQRVG